ncbi:MAG: hypothetical protein ACYDCC_04760 [Actinomycetota bacterium]
MVRRGPVPQPERRGPVPQPEQIVKRFNALVVDLQSTAGFGFTREQTGRSKPGPREPGQRQAQELLNRLLRAMDERVAAYERMFEEMEARSA